MGAAFHIGSKSMLIKHIQHQLHATDYSDLRFLGFDQLEKPVKLGAEYRMPC
jgi:hypothetical protein